MNAEEVLKAGNNPMNLVPTPKGINPLGRLRLSANGHVAEATWNRVENQILLDNLKRADFPTDRMTAAKNIGEKLLGTKIKVENKSQATFNNGNINITLQKEVFDHVQKLLNSGHYFNAVEEAYKIVRQKLKDITGKEKAHEAFSESNQEKIFGCKPKNDAEKDFFEGVKFLHMSIQFLRNEKAHTPAQDLDRNLAIHYISLASLAYDLITRK